MIMSNAVDNLAKRTPGKEVIAPFEKFSTAHRACVCVRVQAMAVEAFARALRSIPTIIADNGGYDSSELVTQLRALHTQGNTTAGLDMDQGVIGDMVELGITESLQVKQQVLVSAHDAAEMILRVDDIIRTAPR